MKKKIAVSVLITMVIIFIIGVVLIFNSRILGENIANSALYNNGGTIDGEKFNQIIDTAEMNFRIFGVILAMFGGSGILLSGYSIYKSL
ncbi:hypothetical protein [Clostridium sp. KNHs205]|jgi:hypothetical protein|uniref:hypothetical protein n=1 Tax=Clostridium sp. KNHs205 TaxID=1449050 RepID=UPI00068A3DFF|nr:hypothetical protein [Clostridium sp. KNHs205]